MKIMRLRRPARNRLPRGEDFTSTRAGRGGTGPVMSEGVGAAADPRAAILEQAAAKKVCVTAVYNRGAVTLAPHSLFERHGELYLRAVRLEFDGRKPREPKLGTFKLSGLSEVAPTRRLFSRSLFGAFDPA